MKISENLGILFLGIWLILSGLFSLLNVHVPIMANLLPLLAVIAGLLILLGSVQPARSLGFILLGIWLVLKGLSPFIYVHIPYFAYLVDLLGIVGGILILLRR